MSARTDFSLTGPFVLLFRGAIGGVPAGAAFYLPLAPQRFEVTLPARGATHATLDGVFLDEFSGPNSVVAQVLIEGTFGYDAKFGGIGVVAPGAWHLKAIELLFEVFNSLSRELKARVNAVTELIVVPRLYFWNIWLHEFSYRITSQEPLLFYYRLRATRLVDYLNPVSPSLPAGISIPGGAALRALF